MLTAEGCRQRRRRLWERLADQPADRIALADRTHLRYLAGADFDAISLFADMPAVLVLERDGAAMPRCLSLPSLLRSPPQISRRECARPS